MATATTLYVNPVMPGHTVAVPEIIPGVAGVAGLTVIGILLLISVIGDTQMAFDVSRTVTISPLESNEVEKLGLFVPVFAPLIIH